MKKYYYSDGKQQIGPLSKEEIQSKGIAKDTLVWSEGLTEWTKASEVAELVDLFPNIPTPPPLPEQKTATPPPIPENKTVTPPPMPKPNDIDNESKTKPKKKIAKTIGIIVGCIILLFIVVRAIETVQYNQWKEEYNKALESECNYPKFYLSLINMAVQDDNVLKGEIKNTAKHHCYSQIKIEINYYDSNKAVIQSDTYTIKGTYAPGTTKPFEVQIRKPQGIRNRINWETRSATIIGAK